MQAITLRDEAARRPRPRSLKRLMPMTGLGSTSGCGRSATADVAAAISQYLGLLGNLESVVDLDAEIPNCAFEFRVPEQQLNGSEISGPPIDHRSFRTSHRMRAVCRCVQTDRVDPRPNNPRILPSRKMR